MIKEYRKQLKKYYLISFIFNIAIGKIDGSKMCILQKIFTNNVSIYLVIDVVILLIFFTLDFNFNKRHLN